jgi:flagellar protein FlgJ
MIMTEVSSQPLPATAATLAGTGRDVASAFEAVMLRQAIEIMLPKPAQSLCGGFAGETWRSMLAERLAEALAQRGGVGIAQAVSSTLARAHRS